MLAKLPAEVPSGKYTPTVCEVALESFLMIICALAELVENVRVLPTFAYKAYVLSLPSNAFNQFVTSLWPMYARVPTLAIVLVCGV